MGKASIGEALTVNSQGSKKTLNCPIAANVDTKFWIDHFKYEKWNNAYNSGTEAVKANCNNDIGRIQFKALNSETFEIITYYTENNNQSLQTRLQLLDFQIPELHIAHCSANWLLEILIFS